MPVQLDDVIFNNNHILPNTIVEECARDAVTNVTTPEDKLQASQEQLDTNVSGTTDQLLVGSEPVEELAVKIQTKKAPGDSLATENDLGKLPSVHPPLNGSNAKLLVVDTCKQVSMDLSHTTEHERAASLVTIPPNITDTPRTPRSAVIKLWVVAVLTLLLCVGLMVCANLTHSLTLRVEAYHSLYNVGALAGSLLSIKLCRQPESLHNTFGWARIDVVSYLISLIFLSSLCFSVAVEAVQTAAHVQHQDPMHYPRAVILVCLAALGVNALVFALIGGYTQHQGSFLEVRLSGDVFVRKQVPQDSLQKGLKTLSARNFKSQTSCPDSATLREGYRDMLRDIVGLLVGIACATVVLLMEGSLLTFYIDPALAVVSVVSLMWLSYPFAKECGSILLQTIPDHIDVDTFSGRLQETFPAIVNVHHLHIWSLRPGKVVATVHMVFASTAAYGSISSALTHFFQQEGISLVTLQPEFQEPGIFNKSKCCCSDHKLDNTGDACDDHANQQKNAHEHGHNHSHSHEHNHKHSHDHDHDDKHDHEHNQNHDHGNNHEHKHHHHDDREINSKQDQNDELNYSVSHKEPTHNTQCTKSHEYEKTSDNHERRSHDCSEHDGVTIASSAKYLPDITKVHENLKKCSKEKTDTLPDSTESKTGGMLSVGDTLHTHEVSCVNDTETITKTPANSLSSLPDESLDDCLNSNILETSTVRTGAHEKSEDSKSEDAINLGSSSSKETPSDDDNTSDRKLNDDQNLTENIASSQEEYFDAVYPPADCEGEVSVPKIEITETIATLNPVEEAMTVDEERNKLYTDLPHEAQYHVMNQLEEEHRVRRTNSEVDLLDGEDYTKVRSDSTNSVDENSSMLNTLTKDSKEYSLTRSVEKLSNSANDHSM